MFLYSQRTVGLILSCGFRYSLLWHWESDTVAYFSQIKSIYYKGMCAQVFYSQGKHVIQTIPCQNPVSRFLVCEDPSAPTHNLVSRSVTLPVLSKAVLYSLSRRFLEMCPSQHMTRESFACDSKTVCRTLTSTERWHKNYCVMSQGLLQPYFYCGAASGEFIPYGLVCDFRRDCNAGMDEHFCVHPPCPQTMFDCGQGQCIAKEKQCDGIMDCVKNTDEEVCLDPPNVKYVLKPPPAVLVIESSYGLTMKPLPHHSTPCPDSHFKCLVEGNCLPVFLRCNGVNDCPSHEDEAGCQQYACPRFYRCRGSDRTICVHDDDLCDGLPQCPQHDDEAMCDAACPSSCICHLLAFTCTDAFHFSLFPQLRYLEARRSGLRQADIRGYSMLIHLGAQACGWQNLTDFNLVNLRSLDLSDNLLSQIHFSHFDRMYNLHQLNLAGNPISSIAFNGQTDPPLALTIFNFSQTHMLSLQLSELSAILPKLEILDLSENKIKSLHGQNVFPNLQVLNLHGCPVAKFTSDLMKSMNLLTHVYADNYKLCCSAILPDNFKGNCLAPFNEISSCGDLLKTNTYRIVLFLFALLAISGNLGSFCYRLLCGSERIKTGFAVFVLHLCISDFCMGVYLTFIGVADQIYADVYVWKEEYWRRSVVCSMAGFLSLMSCEVSAFIICLITLDRFIVLRFPFSQTRFGLVSANVTCALIWTLGFILAVIPLLPFTSHWEFYSQTGICIPLPVTRADFAGHVYSFSVMIICNLILFVLIAVGQSLIIWSIRDTGISKQTTELNSMTAASNDDAKSKEAVIAQRLLTIAMTDFLCWFPIGLCGLLAAANVAVPGEVNVAIAIFVLPLNSALNPFIYTFNIILERRQKARELHLQKILLARIKLAEASGKL